VNPYNFTDPQLAGSTNTAAYTARFLTPNTLTSIHLVIEDLVGNRTEPALVASTFTKAAVPLLTGLDIFNSSGHGALVEQQLGADHLRRRCGEIADLEISRPATPESMSPLPWRRPIVDTDYCLTARAVNAYGFPTEWSVPLTNKTKEACGAGAEFAAANLDHLHWNLLDRFERCRHDVREFHRTPGVDFMGVDFAPADSLTSHLFGNLTPNTTYSFGVRAVTTSASQRKRRILDGGRGDEGRDAGRRNSLGV